MVEMTVERVVVHKSTGEPMALLVEPDGDRCVVVAMRPPEAEVVSQGPQPRRGDDERLGQDLAADVAVALGRRPDRGEIRELVDGRFRAALVLDDGTAVPARPSDVLAVAVRDGLRLVVADDVVAEVGQSFSALWGDRPPPPHEQVRALRDELDEATADDFRTGGPAPGPRE